MTGIVVLAVLSAATPLCEGQQLLTTDPRLADLIDVISGGLVQSQSLIDWDETPVDYRVSVADRKAARTATAIVFFGNQLHGRLAELIPPGTTAAPLLRVPTDERTATEEVWLAEIGNALVLTNRVEALLADLCPAQADVFDFNARLYRQQLEDIQREIERGVPSLSPSPSRTRDRAPATYRAWLRRQHGLAPEN